MRKILTYIVAAATILFPVASFNVFAFEGHHHGVQNAYWGEDGNNVISSINTNGKAIEQNGMIMDAIGSEVDTINTKLGTVVSDTAKAKSDSEKAKSDAEQAKFIAEEQQKQVQTNKNGIAENAGNIATNKQAIEHESATREEAIQATNDHWQVVTDKETAERILGDKRTLQESKAYTDSKFGELKDMVEKNRKETFAGVAAALAASQVPQVTQGSAFSIGAGVGSYQGQTAVAVGMSFRFADDIITKLTVTGDTQQRIGVGAGYAVEW